MVAGVCRICGCTENAACIDERTGQPCHWVNPARRELCSACTVDDEDNGEQLEEWPEEGDDFFEIDDPDEDLGGSGHRAMRRATRDTQEREADARKWAKNFHRDMRAIKDMGIDMAVVVVPESSRGDEGGGIHSA